MTTHRTWQEVQEPSAKIEDIKVIGTHPYNRGVIFTMSRRIPGYFNQEVTFVASLEQAEDIAHSLLDHIRKINSAPLCSPSPDDSVSGSP